VNRPLFISICLVLTGLIYHHHGAGDWLAPTTIPESLSSVQITNELIASLQFTAAMVIWALMPFPGTKEKTK
jgi:hypothetical protein